MWKLHLFIFVILSLTGCADNITFEQAMETTPVGFLHGYWHGVTSIVAGIGSIFSDDITIYAIYNNGGFYNFGYLLGTITLVQISFK